MAFAVLYAVLGVPLAMIADRTSRSRVIAASLVVWSGFTALCGTATSFMSLFLFRLGVGVGEAGGVAPSYALIADYFPLHKRARALAIFSLGVPLGLASGTLIGAYLASWINWRAAFIVMGIAGIALAPVMLLIVRDKPRSKAQSVASPPLRSTFAILARKPSFGCVAGAFSVRLPAMAWAWDSGLERTSVRPDTLSVLARSLIGGTAACSPRLAADRSAGHRAGMRDFRNRWCSLRDVGLH